jgi:hypothetical protein
MRRTLKFLHTMGAVGFGGAIACLLAMSLVQPAPTALAGYAAVRAAMAAVGTWVLLPSLALTLLAGLLAVAATRAFHDAGWAWIKLATGVLLFEGGLQSIELPMRDEAERSAAALAGHAGAAGLAIAPGTERAALGVLGAVAAVNIVLGVWRPRLLRLPR